MDAAPTFETLSWQLDAAYTHYLDALYITERFSLFSALGLSGQWN